MTAESGCYILFLRLPAPTTVSVGKLGRQLFDRPYYAYAGSALGPGGLPARVGRHLKTGKKTHWHIDYLREVTEIVAVWEIVDHTRRECLLADLLATTNGACRVDGFGATDCRCGAHLFGLDELPRLNAFRRRLKQAAGQALPAGTNLRVRGS